MQLLLLILEFLELGRLLELLLLLETKLLELLQSHVLGWEIRVRVPRRRFGHCSLSLDLDLRERWRETDERGGVIYIGLVVFANTTPE